MRNQMQQNNTESELEASDFNALAYSKDLISRHRLNAAEEILFGVVEKDQTQHLAYFMLGNIFEVKANFRAAEQMYSVASRLRPDLKDYETKHKIIKENTHLSAMYSGNIVGIGPRYCPSIEDKVHRFADKSSHQVFIEPEGLDTPKEVIEHRKYHLSRVRTLFETLNLFIFTLGLTEMWTDKQSGTVYPTAPGTLVGKFDSDTYTFKNAQFSEIIDDFNRFQKVLKKIHKYILIT